MGWRPLLALKEQETAKVISCGYIMYEDSEIIIICPHMIIENDEISEGDAEIAIPKAWIVSNLKMTVFPEGD